MRGKVLEWNWLEAYGRDRDRTDDLYRVKVALIPTELSARRTIERLYGPVEKVVNLTGIAPARSVLQCSDILREHIESS